MPLWPIFPIHHKAAAQYAPRSRQYPVQHPLRHLQLQWLPPQPPLATWQHPPIAKYIHASHRPSPCGLFAVLALQIYTFWAHALRPHKAQARHTPTMKLHTYLWYSAAAAALLALSGCVTQPTQQSVASAPAATSSTANVASTAGAILGNVLQANGGASALMSNLGVPAAGTASNAAGVLTYCAKNNYLNPDKAGAMANQLLTSLGLPTAKNATTPAATQDQGYLSGVAGMIVSPSGELFSLDKIKGNVKDKACDFVLNKAQAFL